MTEEDIEKPKSQLSVSENFSNSKRAFILKVISKIEKNLAKSLYYSSSLRLMIQNYFPIAMISFLIVFQKLYFDDVISAINTCLTFVSILFLMMFPIIAFIFLRRNRENLNQEEYQ